MKKLITIALILSLLFSLGTVAIASEIDYVPERNSVRMVGISIDVPVFGNQEEVDNYLKQKYAEFLELQGFRGGSLVTPYVLRENSISMYLQ